MSNRKRILYALYLKSKIEEDRKRSCWTKEWLKERGLKNAGLFSVISRLAKTDIILFKNMMRMDVITFNNLCEELKDKIGKRNTNYWKAISVEERLAITLRFLATGISYILV